MGLDPRTNMPAPPKTAPFEQIYQAAGSRLPQISYGILKVREMADSPHLAGMSPDAKRGALLMALEAAGAQTEDLLQDAVARQRVLTEYEEKQQERLRDFESAKTEANRVIQGELDRLTSQYMARIQANLDEIAQQQDQCARVAEAQAAGMPAHRRHSQPAASATGRRHLQRHPDGRAGARLGAAVRLPSCSCRYLIILVAAVAIWFGFQRPHPPARPRGSPRGAALRRPGPQGRISTFRMVNRGVRL